MTTPHADLADEFRALARAALERMEPLLRAAQDDAAPTEPWQGCTWCPVCAVAALVKGERHPLVTVLARESEQVLTALRALLHDHAAQAHSGHPGAAYPTADHAFADNAFADDAFADHAFADHVHGAHAHGAAADESYAEGDGTTGDGEPDDHAGSGEPGPNGGRPNGAGPGGGATYQPIEVTIDDGSAGT